MRTCPIHVWIPLLLTCSTALMLADCGPTASSGVTTPTSTGDAQVLAPGAPPPAAPTTQASGAPAAGPIPQACALLTVADVEKLTGYTGGIADSQNLGNTGVMEQATQCLLVIGQGKVQVQVTAGRESVPQPPVGTLVDLDGGAKDVVRDSGIGQQWMNLVTFPNYSVTLFLGGSAAQLDLNKRVAVVARADGSTLTYAQAFDALARAIAHNAATGAQTPAGVSDINAKGDPCALLTLADVQQVITDFAVTGPETRPSVFGGNGCWFRAASDTLKTTVQLQINYLTVGQAQQRQAATNGPAQTRAIGGVTMTLDPAGGWVLLRGKDRYAYLGMAASVDSPDPDAMTKVAQTERAWLMALAQVIAGRM